MGGGINGDKNGIVDGVWPGGEEVNASVCKTDMRGCESLPGLK